MQASIGDETTKIILNTKGSVGEISEDLKATLRYIDGEDPQSEYTVNLRNEVEDVRVSEKWRREYMTLMMRDKQNKRLGRYESAVSCVRELYGEIDDSRIMSMAKITQEEYDTILRCITEHTDWDDEDIADWLIEEFE